MHLQKKKTSLKDECKLAIIARYVQDETNYHSINCLHPPKVCFLADYVLVSAH